ncbi:MAG: protein-glutamate O-methyltransferase [Mariprofundaceae bacterium]
MSANHTEREFSLSAGEFKTLCEMATAHAGIQLLNRGKEDMVYSRLARRLRAVGLNSFKDYIQLLNSDIDSEEFGNFINALTTNLTAFFREEHHFEYLSQTVLPELMRRNATSRRIRIWSAGCSSGEEPYSIAMVVAETVPKDWDVRILATDLDSNMVHTGEQGVYAEGRQSGISKARLSRWFQKNSNGDVRAKAQLRDMITFRQLNLLHDWPMKGPMDVVFCRNVIIYFDQPIKQKLMSRYAALMHDKSTLYIGHSETLFKVSDEFKLIGKTIYAKG